MAAAENKVTLPNQDGGLQSPQTEASLPTSTSQKHATSDFYRTHNLPDRFEHPECFQGYNTKSQNPMYRTTSMEIGSRSPTVHHMPNSFHARSQQFSVHLGTCGMYRNHGLNTSTDKSKV
ncbi:piercer of microtubule wall 1 protein-like [Antedon mediterranea]|uniref:piercer of microtubule wall 1 protein-like n=1 Tax=Antedon mediterranea TaxID=105859 RepID=UPI003AF9B985